MPSASASGLPTVVVLVAAGDAGGGRLTAALRRRGRASVASVSDVRLSLATWRNGPVLTGVPATGALVHCRVPYLPAVRFAVAPPEEQSYAAAELNALALSWLASLGERAINRPTPLGLAGRHRSLFEWLALGAEVGLPVADGVLASSAARVPAGTGVRRSLLSDGSGALPPVDVGPSRRRPALLLDVGGLSRALVVGDRVLDGPPGLAKLAQAAGCDILEVLLRDDGAVVGADPVPALLDDDHVEAVAELLEQRARR